MVSSRDFVAAFEKGLQVIEAFEHSSTRLTLSEVAERVGITRAAARRYLLTLTELGYAEHDGRRFALTPRVLRLAGAHLHVDPIPRLAQGFLDTIAGQCLESASAGVLADADVLFVARALSPRPVSIHIAVGTRLPAFCTAMGKVLLAALPDAAVLDLLKRHPPRALSPKTRTGLPEIIASVRATRQAGHAISSEEMELGLKAIAVPVKNARGITTFALGLSVPAERMSDTDMTTRLLPYIRKAADALATMH